MTHIPAPFLCQFGEKPRDASGLLDIEVDANTGLIRKKGAEAPLIDELEAGILSTQFPSRTPDPDVFRADSRVRDGSNLLPGLGTILTKQSFDPIDPDVVRSMQSVRCGGLSTILTESRPDQPDPDVIRASRRCDR